jgi:large subunit ribosomal protein L18
MRTTLLAKKAHLRQRRRWRVRQRVTGAPERPRLAFHKSARHIYAQAIDDLAGKTLAHVTTATKANAAAKKNFANIAQAKQLGAAFGAALKDKGITTVVFDRGGHIYHGVVKAFADAVREQGIRF